ncbi:DNA-binding transcriptional MocR family regulator [Inquilinus ginsengisoli]|uniref:DNA-binding transcriptional MocR family regulator n=1 Tax=Inquilinus ginsengisoli TaxID=363840 RepID=A0ABU1JZC5_9PROT|nr:PLP-dependent aminotransferase family protein [Inquilinus ginsengisoli]MDR6293975.1 DNA-binding transcriptional MocR family regulator [Inquilinus ginsengisoli]
MSIGETHYATRAAKMRASEIRELLKLLDRPGVISFAGGIPDPALFPTDVIREGYAAALDAGGAALQYSVSEGYVPLRQWLVRHMASIGVPCTIDNIVITSGSQQGLDYLGKLFLSPGDTALVTWPAYLGALQAFNAYEPRYDRLAPEHGNTTPAAYRMAAEAAGGRVALAYLTPDFANPSGETLSLDGRRRALALADELDIPVIEDAAYQQLRYDGEDVPPLQALDVAAKGGDIDRSRVTHSGSFSKTLAPGLRIGWICAARGVVQKLVLTKQAADLHTPTINQMVMHHAAEHAHAAQVAKIRAAYRDRRDHMLAALLRHMPAGVSWTRPQGGMFIWVTLPEGLDGAELLARAVEQGVAFVPGRAFHADGTGGNSLRLSFSLADAAAIETGIGRLGALIAGAAQAAA